MNHAIEKRFNIEEIQAKAEVKITKYFPGAQLVGIARDKVTGLYMLRLSEGHIMYTNANIDFLITNTNTQNPEIFSLNKDVPENVTSTLNMPINKSLLENFSDGIVFRAKNERAIVRVFSDPACGYCQKLHGKIAQYNALGITIEYAARPIFGPVPEEAFKRLWSLPAKQRAEKFTTLKDFFAKHTGMPPDWNELKLPEATQKGIDIVTKQNQLGLNLGFTGTPGLVLPNGLTINGYQSPEDLNRILVESGY